MDDRDANTITETALVDVLKDSVEEVFASFVLMFRTVSIESGMNITGDGPGEPPTDESVHTEAIVHFTGDQAGAVVLRCSTQGALVISRALLMLREDDEREEEEIADALGECANMVTGVLKTKALDPVGSFHLGLPEIRPAVSSAEHADHSQLIYELSGGLFKAEIWLDVPAG